MATDYGTFYWPAGRNGGGGSGSAQASGTAAISDGASSVTVTYDVTLSTAVPPIVSVINSIDGSPIFLNPVVTAYSTTGFTATFNAPADSANYVLQYAVFGAV